MGHREAAPTKEPFRPGQRFEVDGLWVKVDAGKKTAPHGGQDLRFSVRTSGWVVVTMPAIAALTEAIFENENVLYPPSDGLRGGEMLLDFLRTSCRLGWRRARAELEAQKLAKAERQADLWEAS